MLRLFGTRFRRAVPHAKALLYGCALCALIACSHKAPQPNHAINVTPFPQPTDSVKTYPISAAFSKTGPKLTKDQRAWIAKVMRSRYYRDLSLRFAQVPGVVTPIVVYVDRAVYGIHRGGHVIGEQCQIWFDPVAGRTFSASPAVCTRPTPKPVVAPLHPRSTAPAPVGFLELSPALINSVSFMA